MYSFVKSVALSRSIGSQWTEVDLSAVMVYDVWTQYGRVYLVLSNPDLPSHVNVDMESLRAEFSNYIGTISDLLVTIGNRTLTYVDSLPSTVVKFAKYSDATRSQYHIDITKIGVVSPDNYPVSEMHDLRITRPTFLTDLSLLHSHCLISVNGYYHRTDYDASGAYVYRGADTMRLSNANQLGILSFLDIGSVTKVPLVAADIIPQAPGSPLAERIYFSVPDDLDDRSYILILGGYIVMPESGVFWRQGEHEFGLDLTKIPYVERIYESSLYIDLADLQLTTDPINADMINTSELYSDDVIRRYLTLSQSYLAIIDTPNLVSNKIHLRHSNLPGMFTSYQDPTYPLIVNYGKVAEYWKTYEDEQWSVTVADSFMRHYVLSQQPIGQLPNVTPALLSSQPYSHSRGYLLELSAYS